MALLTQRTSSTYAHRHGAGHPLSSLHGLGGGQQRDRMPPVSQLPGRQLFHFLLQAWIVVSEAGRLYQTLRDAWAATRPFSTSSGNSTPVLKHTILLSLNE